MKAQKLHVDLCALLSESAVYYMTWNVSSQDVSVNTATSSSTTARASLMVWVTHFLCDRILLASSKYNVNSSNRKVSSQSISQVINTRRQTNKTLSNKVVYKLIIGLRRISQTYYVPQHLRSIRVMRTNCVQPIKPKSIKISCLIYSGGAGEIFNKIITYSQ